MKAIIFILSFALAFANAKAQSKYYQADSVNIYHVGDTVLINPTRKEFYGIYFVAGKERQPFWSIAGELLIIKHIKIKGNKKRGFYPIANATNGVREFNIDLEQSNRMGEIRPFQKKKIEALRKEILEESIYKQISYDNTPNKI